MSIEDQLQRQTNINIQLRRQLEQCRKDTVEYCAKFCEDHEVGWDCGKSICVFTGKEGRRYRIAGDGYAEALRGIIGK